MENGEEEKTFTKEEVKQILNESLDYSKFFKKPDSKEKLMDALNLREMTLGFTEPKDFRQKMSMVKKVMGIS